MIRRARAYARLMRVSNAPTVVTNVMVGFAISRNHHGISPEFKTYAAALLIYFAGMLFNDVFDAKHDQSKKPDRPIPSGVVSRLEVAIVGSLMMAAGLGLAFWVNTTVGQLAIALCGCVLLYDWLHKLSPAFILVMGACRAFVYAMGFFDFNPERDISLLWAVILSIVLYIALLTFVARREDDGSAGWRSMLSVLMPFTILPAIVIVGDVGLEYPHWFTFVAAGIYLLWMARSCWLLLRKTPDIRGAVLGWLSGICLFDAMLLVSMGDDDRALFALACFALTALAHKFVPGT